MRRAGNIGSAKLGLIVCAGS